MYNVGGTPKTINGWVIGKRERRDVLLKNKNKPRCYTSKKNFGYNGSEGMFI